MTRRIGPRPHTVTTPTVTAPHPTPCHGPHASWWDQLDLPGGERPPARAARHAKAIQVCHTCPVMTQCLDDRLHGGDRRGGVHGGRVFVESSTVPERAVAAREQAA